MKLRLSAQAAAHAFKFQKAATEAQVAQVSNSALQDTPAGTPAAGVHKLFRRPSAHLSSRFRS